MSALVEEMNEIVRSIPAGRVMNYGQIGELLSNKVSGKIIGAWLQKSEGGLPWWRVVAKDGSFPVGKLDPVLQKLQIELLTEEGVPLRGHQVVMALARFEP